MMGPVAALAAAIFLTSGQALAKERIDPTVRRAQQAAERDHKAREQAAERERKTRERAAETTAAWTAAMASAAAALDRKNTEEARKAADLAANAISTKNPDRNAMSRQIWRTSELQGRIQEALAATDPPNGDQHMGFAFGHYTVAYDAAKSIDSAGRELVPVLLSVARTASKLEGSVWTSNRYTQSRTSYRVRRTEAGAYASVLKILKDSKNPEDAQILNSTLDRFVAVLEKSERPDQESLPLLIEIAGTQDPRTRTVARRLTAALLNAHDPAGATEVVERVFGKEAVELIVPMMETVRLAKSYDDAHPAMERILAIASKTDGPEGARFAELLAYWSEKCTSLKNAGESFTFGQRAWEILRKQKTPDQSRLITIASKLAGQALELRKAGDAETLLVAAAGLATESGDTARARALSYRLSQEVFEPAARWKDMESRLRQFTMPVDRLGPADQDAESILLLYASALDQLERRDDATACRTRVDQIKTERTRIAETLRKQQERAEAIRTAEYFSPEAVTRRAHERAMYEVRKARVQYDAATAGYLGAMGMRPTAVWQGGNYVGDTWTSDW